FYKSLKIGDKKMIKIIPVKGNETNKVEYILTDELHREYYFTSGTVSDDKVITRDQIIDIANLTFFEVPKLVINSVLALCESCQYCPDSTDNFKVDQTGKVILGGAMAHIAKTVTSYKDQYDKFLNEEVYNSIKFVL